MKQNKLFLKTLDSSDQNGKKPRTIGFRKNVHKFVEISFNFFKSCKAVLKFFLQDLSFKRIF